MSTGGDCAMKSSSSARGLGTHELTAGVESCMGEAVHPDEWRSWMALLSKAVHCLGILSGFLLYIPLTIEFHRVEDTKLQQSGKTGACRGVYARGVGDNEVRSVPDGK